MSCTQMKVKKLMKRIGYALILAVSVPILIFVLVYAWIFVIPTLFYSDFDRFAKATISEFGNDSRRPTEALRGYLRERQVEDPVAFLKENAEVGRKVHIDDSGLGVTQRKSLRRSNATSSQGFYKTFPMFPIGEAKLSIFVYEKRGGGIELVASTGLTSL